MEVELTSQAGLVDGDGFTERVDVTTQPDGAFIGTMEIGVKPATEREREAERLIEENTALRDRVAELEQALQARS